MAQTQLDKLMLAWDQLRRVVNVTLPAQADRARAARRRTDGSSPPGPRPS